MKLIFTSLIALFWIHLAFAAPAVSTGSNVQALPDDATYIPDGIDIYPSVATEDGENHYIHVSEDSSSGAETRYIFQYCRGGLPVEQARRGLFPKTRDCYHSIGSAAGYTRREIQAELDLMMKQAKSQKHSQLLASVGSSVVSGVVVLVALNLVEAVTTGGAANVATDGALAASGVLGRYLGTAVLKKVAIDGSKLIISTVAGTFIGQGITSRIGQASMRRTNDNPFSSPSEMKYTAGELGGILSSGSVVIISNDMQSFEADLNLVLNKIQ